MLLKLLLALSFAHAASKSMSEKEASEDPRWLRLFQYEKTFLGNWKSPITTSNFFISPDGEKDPLKELTASVDAYSHPEKKFGIQKFPAACTFPARKIILEELLGMSFPKVDCPDLKDWVERIGADQINLVFVGAYPGNPASILGHTFIRFANQRSELLNYSVGYMAVTDPSDTRITYVVKGITGGYDGFYEIEPHYMKVGLYNNSESRDLWEVKLNLTPREVDLLILYFWELTFNSKSPYYFIDENCSYRLIQYIEAMRPDLNVTPSFPLVVLPAETVRAVIESGLASPIPQFRPSVKRRLAYKLTLLDKELQQTTFEARESAEKTTALKDPTAIDALLDFWLYTNYKAHAQLKPDQAKVMEATFARAASLQEESRFKGTSNEQVREKFGLRPPFLGHPPSWIQIDAGISELGSIGGFKYRNGAHPLWSTDPGYADAAAIEYLGAEIQWRDEEKARWSLLLIEVKSLSEFSAWEKEPSWTFAIDLKNHCPLCLTDNPQIHFKGGVGLSLRENSNLFYLMAHADAAGWSDATPQAMLAPGFIGGLKVPFRETAYTAEFAQHWWKSQDEFSGRLIFSKAFTRDGNALVELLYEDGRGRDYEISSTVGWTSFF